MQLTLCQSLVKAILLSPYDLIWSTQGLGMLRVYLDKDHTHRLHIWDESLKVYDASPLHDHPWHLASSVVAGELRNTRYLPTVTTEALNARLYRMATIKCGENACKLSEPEDVYLRRQATEVYGPGDNYYQSKYEIHESQALNGTVTLVTRTFEGDKDQARVFWRGGGDFVSAEPRQATTEEVERVTQTALSKWLHGGRT